MFFIDTHTHLYDESFIEDIDTVISNSINAGVKKMLLPNCDIHTVNPMLDLSKKYPENLYPMLGLHPCYIKEDYKLQLSKILEFESLSDYVAVGEIGLDYYWDQTFIQEQKDAFSIQINWAKEKNLPIVIHTRDSIDDGIDIVLSHQNGNLNGVFHCFSGDVEQAKKIADLGFYMGIGGVVTFKKSNLRDILRSVPLDKIILETDSPYLAPVPYRGKRNESSYIPYIAEELSKIYELPIQKIAEVTSQNAMNLFTKIN